jgi:hypothetical protein
VVGIRYVVVIGVAVFHCSSSRFPNPFAALRIDVVDARGTWNESVRHVVLHILEAEDEPNWKLNQAKIKIKATRKS